MLELQSSPKVTVVVPIYNGEQFVNSCCSQLFAQTLREIEIVLVDDGSNDRTGKLCDEIQCRCPSVVVIHQENAGVSAARNKGAMLARGEYVAFLDVDDEYDSDMLESEYNIAVATDADVVCLDPVSINPNETVLLDGPQRAIEYLLSKRIGMSCCNKLFKKELVATGPFPVGTRIHEDFAALYSVFCSVSVVACKNLTKYHYVHREGSSSRARNFSEKYFDAIDVIDGIAGDIKRRWPALSEVAEARRAMVYLRISKIYWLRGAPVEHRKRISKIKEYLRALPNNLVRRWFIRNDVIRLLLYLHCFPLFLLLIKTVDTN